MARYSENSIQKQCLALRFLFLQDGEVRDGLNRRQRDEERARMLRAKANSGRTLTRWERNQLRKIEEAERLRRRLERQKRNAGRSCCGKISLMLRPFRVLFGIIFLLISLLIMISVIITRYFKSTIMAKIQGVQKKI